MYSAMDDRRLRRPGFPIRTPSGQRLFGSYPRLIAAFRVLRRLLAPRHPPYALSSLTAILVGDGCRRPGQSLPWGRVKGLLYATFRYSIVKEPVVPIRDGSDCSAHAFSSAPPSFAHSTSLRATEGSFRRRRKLVETSGLEPPTSGLQSRRSPS